MRHSFASLLLAAGHQPLYVAEQLGHSVAVLLSTYAHLMAEYEQRERIDPDAETAAAQSPYPLSTRRGDMTAGPPVRPPRKK